MFLRRKKIVYLILSVLFIFIFIYFLLSPLLIGLANYVIYIDEPEQADAAVVLYNPNFAEYALRLQEAARLYKIGKVNYIIINGNRKYKPLIDLEKQGFIPSHPWYTLYLDLLTFLEIPKEAIIFINAPFVSDTVSEAKAVGEQLLQYPKIKTIIITSSNYHTRRALYIWQSLFQDQFKIYSAGASEDMLEPEKWWQEVVQIKFIVAEYGARLIYLFKGIK